MGYARYAWLGVVLFTLVAPAPPSHAAKRKLKVLGLKVESEHLSKKDKNDLFKAIQTRLKAYPNITLLEPPKGELTDLMMDLECIDLDTACLAKVGKKFKAKRVFYTQVKKAKGGGHEITVKVIHVRRKRVLKEQTTKTSSLSGLVGALDDPITGAFGAPPTIAKPKPKPKPVVVAKPKPKPKPVVVKKPKPKPKPKPVVVKKPKPKPVVVKKKKPRRKVGLLKVKSAVPGAKIFVGKELVGVGKIRVKKKPGNYVIRVASPGYRTAVIKVAIRAGKVTKRRVRLVWAAKTFKEPGKKDKAAAVVPVYKKWWFWTVVGAVVVGTTVAAAASGGSGKGSSSRGGVVLSVDPQNAWRDAAVQRGMK